MILVDWEIEQLIRDGLTDEKWIPLINSASLNVTIGSNANLLTKSAPDITDRFGNGFKTIPVDRLVFSSGARVLVDIEQHLTLPPNIAAQFQLRSTYGRGFYENVLAGYIDPGFTGVLTLELINHSYIDLPLNQGDSIGQIVFYRCQKPRKPYQGKYQGDKRVEVAKRELNELPETKGD